MKKIVVLLTLLTISLSFSQSEEMLKMYEKITGKDLSKEIEKLRSQKGIGDEEKTELSELDTIPIIEMEDIKEDSVEIPLTYFEKYVNGEIIDPYQSELKQFSIDFSSVRTKLNFNKKIPGSYILSTGDTFVIDIWGAMENSYTVELNNEGYVIIPQIGKVDLSGMNYNEAKDALKRKLSRINGLEHSIRLSEVKPVTVFVVGNVMKPGVYNISPFSSIIEVLALAGGITRQGSYREISLIPENGGSRKIDLYSLLFFGKNPVSVIESNMTVFIPLIGKQIAVAGNVKHEGIFEYLKGEDLSDILKIAGKTPFSDLERIEIERINNNGRKEAFSVSLKNDPDLKDGDIIRIFSTLVFNSEYVYLKGSFRHNKNIEFNPGMKLKDIFSGREVLKENTDMDYGNIIRKNGLGKRDIMINFSPESVLEKKGDHEIELSARDTIQTFLIDSVRYFPSVEISGEVKKPGKYKSTKDMKVSNLIAFAGGITDIGDRNSILVIRSNGADGIEYFTDIDTKKFILKENDKVHIFDYTAKNPVQYVRIYGHIKKYGQYIHSENMTVKDLIKLSGGYKNDALTDSIEVVKGINKNNDVLSTGWYSSNEINLIDLDPNDIVFVRRIRDYGRVNYVKIFGEVQYPGIYALRENEEFDNLLERCGGFTDNAQIKSTRIFREEVKKKQESKIRELRDDLNNKINIQMMLSGNDEIASALNVSKFDSIVTSGRVIIDIDENGNHEEFFFQDKDSIWVPPVSRTVLVMGEVYQQTAINFNNENTEVEYYLNKVGGITDTGDDDNIYVIKSNGELIKEKGWFDNIMSHDIEPGDMVYVPYDYDRIDYLTLTKDITTILYQLTLSAATVYQVSK